MYNHDAPHQVAHTAPVLDKVVSQNTDAEIIVAYSNESIRKNIETHLSEEAKGRIQFLKLGYNKFLHSLDFLNKVIPYTRIMNLVGSRKLISRCTHIVTPETTSLFLKRILGLYSQKFIFIPHGAGDRSVGFRKDAREFDLILVSGQKTRKRFIEDAGVPADRIKIIGYPKFDAFFKRDCEAKLLFPEKRPIVLYNPHFDPNLSSWYYRGLEVLEYFANSKDYNLIFAPHIMLFKKRVHASVEHGKKAIRKDIPAKYYKCSNIHIDVDSDNLVDMTYTKMADIYMGDVSSQIYEFIYLPRPAVFLCNDHLTNWEGDPNFRHWNFGPVLMNGHSLTEILSFARNNLEKMYKPCQEKAFLDTFDNVDGNSSFKAAQQIIEFVSSY